MAKAMKILRLVALYCGIAGSTAAEVSVDIAYLRIETPSPPILSNLDPEPEDIGLAGAEVGLADNQTTGRFLGHLFSLATVSVPEDADPLAAAAGILASTRLVLLDAPAETLLAIADLPEAEGALLFNTADPATALRDAECRANLLHTLPSTDMRTDSLVQFLVARRWSEIALVEGTYPEDVAFAAALDHSLQKFGLEIGARKTWAFDADMRRNAAQEVPVFTQELGEYEVLLVADEIGDFGRYILYNTWLPRPVAGSEGLTPEAWSPVVEQWGAAQLQSRFGEHAGRDMRSQDYAAWAAMRSIGEAVTRTGSTDIAVLRDFILSEDFELAGFKGTPQTFRTWNGQMRQPIPLVQPRALVAQAPLEGFLHQRTELDTLGVDLAETACTAFADD